jgi:hypothetical protein
MMTQSPVGLEALVLLVIETGTESQPFQNAGS